MKARGLYVTIFAIGLWMAVSCEKLEGEAGASVVLGRQALVAINFRVNPEQLIGESESGFEGVLGREGGGPGSRSVVNAGTDTDEGTTPGYVPRDVWVIQYDGTEDDAHLSGLPRYVELSGPTNIQAVASTTENTLVFVANTHDSTLEWGDIGTLAKIRQACVEIDRESDCFGNNYSLYKDLIFSGVYEGVVDNSAISVDLFRNIARLDFTLKNGPASGMTPKSIQLCNVPKDFYYATALVPQGALFPSMINYFDYPCEPLVASSIPGGEESFVFYMPVNQRGVVAGSTSGKTKSGHAPSYSSYIKITALDAQNKAYVYKIYPGANVVNDYNISANNRYVLDLTINSSGEASTDGRVESYHQRDFESANAFILNPSPEGSAPRFFTIPIDKVNEFWKDQDLSLTIGPADAWTVELIWQDTSTPNCIGFVDLNDPNAGPTNVFNGTGPDQRIALLAKPGSQGNALIGLKKVGRGEVGYLWSWHLWVTDYDPTYEAAADPDQFVYSVPGGAVHRYQGAAWTLPGGKYYTKYIMDRNLGARHSERTMIGTLYYQFGRKDPMPMVGYGNVLYDINGTPLAPNDPRNATTMSKSSGLTGVTIATSVLNPTIYYYCQDGYLYHDWTSDSRLGDYSWNHPVAGLDQRSMFDPCPSGWQLPVRETWLDFRRSDSQAHKSTAMDGRRHDRLSWDYGGTNGVRYWPEGKDVIGSIYYPTFGHRFAQSGAVTSTDLISYYWSASSSFTASAAFGGLSPISSDWRSHGFQVRCVQQ